MEKKRGGKREGAGRPPVVKGEPTMPVPIRLTLRQREKLKHLGGSSWVRKKIDSANGDGF